MCNKWISVEDRLPELYTDVLIFDELGVGFANRDCNGNWFWFSLSGIQTTKNVTHWQPLPEPPEPLDD